MRLVVLLLVVLTPLTSVAAGGGHGHGDIPWSTIFAQIFNFSILVFGLGYLAKKKGTDHFQKRTKDYNSLVTRAESAKKEAEMRKKTISERIQALEGEKSSSIEKAKAEAVEMKQRMMKEAEEISTRLQKDVQQTVESELLKAKLKLKSELLEGALTLAKESMQKSLQGDDQKRLQTEFFQKVQVVN